MGRKIIDVLKKSEKLVYFNRCWLHRNDVQFRNVVLSAFQNPNIWEIKENGMEYEGVVAYHIREHGNGTGFFGELKIALLKLLFAEERGLQPFIEWGKEFLYYEDNGVRGITNGFEYYFKPVSFIKNIDNARFVLEAEYRHYQCICDELDLNTYLFSEKCIQKLIKLVKKYIYFNEYTEGLLKKESTSLLNGKKTIGVHYRGTDFNQGFNNHPKVITVDEEIEVVKKLFVEKKYKQIFLATDDISAIKKFEEVFGENVKYFNDTYRSEGNQSVAFSIENRENHHYQLGLEVLKDVYTLINCDALVCGHSNVTYMTQIMKHAWMEKQYEDYILIDHGFHHNNNYFGKSEEARKRN